MGMKVYILEFTGCTDKDSEQDHRIIHGIADAGGDMATICGIPFVDEVERYKETPRAITCGQCMGVLSHTAKYEFRKGKWF